MSTPEGTSAPARDATQEGTQTPQSPGERAERETGPLGPDGEEGYTELGEIQGPDDPRIAEIFEERADPEAKAKHEEVMARAEGIRLDSMGYKYQSGGFGSAMLSMVWPGSAMKEGWNRLTGENMYSSGEGWVSDLQSGIERIRGLMKMVNEVLGVVSTITGVVAAVSAAIAAILSWTGVGGAAAGAVAAVAFKLSVISGLLRGALSFIDSLLSIVQIVFNIARARLTDDPIERARLCHQMKAESSQYADSLADAATEAVSAPVGGAGKAIGRGAVSTARAAARGGVRGGLRRAKRLALVLPRRTLRAAGRGLRRVPGRLRARLRMIRIKAKGMVPGSRVFGARLRRWGGDVRRNVQEMADPASRQRLAAQLQERHHQELLDSFGDIGPEVRAVGLQTRIGAPRAARAGLGAMSTPELTDVAKKGRDIEKAKAGGGPSASGPGEGVNPNLTYNQVAYWPSVLERMGTIREDIHTAQERMKGHYDKAAEDAGDKRSAVAALMGEPAQSGTRMRMAGGQQQREAQAGRDRATDAQEQIGQALDAKREGSQQLEEAQTEGEAAGEETDTAEQDVQGAEDVELSLWERAKKWLYEQTIGRAFRGLARIKKGISDFVLEVALGAAGLGEDDMDLAGMQSESEADAEADERAQEDAAGTEEEANTVDDRIQALKETGDNQEQAAIQGMVDAGDYIDALDQYDQALAEEQDHGTNYISDATERVAAAVDSPDGLVNAAYVAPILEGAAYLQERAQAFPEELRGAGAAAAQELQQNLARQSMPPTPGTRLASEAADAVADAAAESLGQIASRAAGLASDAAALVGDHAFPTAENLAASLDALGGEYQLVVSQAVESLGARIDAILAGYGAATQRALASMDEDDARTVAATGASTDE